MLEFKILPFPLRIKKTNQKSNLKMLPILSSTSTTSPPKGKADIRSSVHGKIETIVLVLPPNGKAINAYPFYHILRELVFKMNDEKQFIVIHQNNETEINKELSSIPYDRQKVHLLKIVNLGDKIQSWVQDVALPVYYTHNLNSQLYLIGGTKSDRDERDIIEDLSIKHLSSQRNNSINYKVLFKNSVLPFQGGNVLVGPGFILIGEDDRTSNFKNYSKEYKKWFGITPIFLKSKPNLPIQKYYPSIAKHTFPPNETTSQQPLYHIDMFITLAGYDDNGDYILVIGNPVLDTDIQFSNDQELLLYINQWVCQIRLSINTIIEQLKQEKSISFRIIRIPLVLSYEDDEPIIKDNILYRCINWFWATYNNCLVEVYKQSNSNNVVKKVWLPSYAKHSSDYRDHTMDQDLKNRISQKLGIPNEDVKHGNWRSLEIYEKKATAIWEQLGFEVNLLDSSFIPFALDDGSLNCITNCINRT
jgi:hypothetical protein